MVRWLVMLGAMGGLTGCGLIDSLLSDASDSSNDSEGTGEGPGYENPGREDPGTAALRAQCELGADAFCTCLSDGCVQEEYDTLVKNCLQDTPEADFVLCFADQVDDNFEIECRDAAEVCLGVTLETGDTGSPGGPTGTGDTGGDGGSGDEDTGAPQPPGP